MNWLLARLREPSTWRGLIWLLAALGVTVRPELWESIAALGMAVAGLLGILLTEKPRETVRLPPIDLVGRAGAAPAGGLRLDVPPGHYTQPELDERGAAPEWHGFNDR